MGTDEQLAMQHVGKLHASGVLGCARISRYRDLRQRRVRLSNDVEIHRRVALPFLRDDRIVALNQRVFGTVSATGGIIPDHRLLDHND